MVLRAGLPLQDMEFVQFHPHRHLWCRRTDHRGVRGEGGYLTNSEVALHGRYAPNARIWHLGTWSAAQ